MKAICAGSISGVVGVAHRWISATRLPRVDSPPRFSVTPSARRRALERLRRSGRATSAPRTSRSGDRGVDDGLDRRVLRVAEQRAARALDPDVVGDHVDRLTGRGVEGVDDLVERHAVLTGREHRTLLDRVARPLRHRERAAVLQVGVTGDDRVDVGVDVPEQVAEGRPGVVHRGAVGRGRALVEQQHDHVGTIGLQLRGVRR